MTPTIHATAILTGSHALLIRGPSGSGKSRLALGLLAAAGTAALPFARLVGDDRCQVQMAHGRLLARPAPGLEGLIEVRGLGIRRVPYEPVAVVGTVVDLAAADARRLPEAAEQETELDSVRLPRLAVAPGSDPFSAVFAYLQTQQAGA